MEWGVGVPGDQLFGRKWPADRPKVSLQSDVVVLDSLVGRIPRVDTHLVQEEDHGGATIDVIYGIRCWLCDRQLFLGFLWRFDHPLAPYSKIGIGNINKVAQNTRSMRLRLRSEQIGPVANTINEEAAIQPTHEHATEHLQKGDLPPGKQPRDAFRLMMDVIILLPVGEDLRSWEWFWQFFCHCRRIVWGWNQR